MRKGYRQIGKPKFDLRQALDRLLFRTTVVSLTRLRRRWCEFLRFGDFSKVSCEGAKLLRTIAEKYTGRERLGIWQTNSRTRNGTC